MKKAILVFVVLASVLFLFGCTASEISYGENEVLNCPFCEDNSDCLFFSLYACIHQGNSNVKEVSIADWVGPAYTGKVCNYSCYQGNEKQQEAVKIINDHNIAACPGSIDPTGCYLFIAYQTQDVTLCEKIDAVDVKKDCLADLTNNEVKKLLSNVD